MLGEIFLLLIKTVFSLYTMVVIARLLMQWARADFYNPISQFVVKVTNPPLKPLRKVIPGFWGIDFSTIALACLVQLAGICLLALIFNLGFTSFPAYLLLAILGAVSKALDLIFFAILIIIVISWIAPDSYNPAAMLLRQIVEPILKPFRNLIPGIGGLDFSPMIAMLVIHILNAIMLSKLVESIGGPAFVKLLSFI